MRVGFDCGDSSLGWGARSQPGPGRRWTSLYELGLSPGEIIGGREAQPHSRPYMAYLGIQRRNKNYSCRGFLVAENFVLTAAHCNGE
uniref:Peptidase S1 domain-containing protein n=1 Tax=Chrysemys picta bellii TaxID=8478 RepID=A0A8C3F4M4_CHRPI